jgi:hypothetical protein
LQPLQITGNAELRLRSFSTNPHNFLAMMLNRTRAIHTTKNDNVKLVKIYFLIYVKLRWAELGADAAYFNSD